MSLIIDASVAIKWFVEEELSAEARSLSEYRGSLHAPDFAVVEMANIAWKKVMRKEIDRVQATDIVGDVRDGVLRFYPSILLHGRALEIALDLEHPVYDCLYLACAEEVPDGRVVTADDRLCSVVTGGRYAGLVTHLTDVASDL